MVAGCAVGMGVALARNGRLRLLAGDDGHDPELGLLPGEPLTEGLVRMAREQSELAIRLLDDRSDVIPPQAVHETRKALKRLRTLLRLVRSELGDGEYERQADALRAAASRLAEARDAEVMLRTLDRLLERHPKRLARRAGVRRLRAALHAEAEGAQRRVGGDPLIRSGALVELWAFRRGIEGWTLQPATAPSAIEDGLRRLYRQGRTRHRRVARGKGDQVAAVHEWRKRVKDLRYSAEMLGRAEPHGAIARLLVSRNGTAPAGPAADASGKRLRRLGRRSDRLAETLGEDHDLALLAERVRAAGRGRRRDGRVLGRRSRKALLQAIRRRRRRLRRRALRDGDRVYRSPPKRLLRDVRSAQAAWAAPLS